MTETRDIEEQPPLQPQPGPTDMLFSTGIVLGQDGKIWRYEGFRGMVQIGTYTPVTP
jgi:hypothetical protein